MVGGGIQCFCCICIVVVAENDHYIIVLYLGRVRFKSPTACPIYIHNSFLGEKLNLHITLYFYNQIQRFLLFAVPCCNTLFIDTRLYRVGILNKPCYEYNYVIISTYLCINICVMHVWEIDLEFFFIKGTPSTLRIINYHYTPFSTTGRPF